MKKIAMLAVLLLASNVFAGMVITGPSGNLPSPATVTISMNNDGGSSINGVDIWPQVAAGQVLVTDWTVLSTTLPVKINAALTIDSVAGTDLATLNDLGVKSTAPSVGTAASGDLIRLTLKLAPGVNSAPVTFNGYWADTDFGEDVGGQVAFTLTPEPVSALLLGLGSLFFARRRRA